MRSMASTMGIEHREDALEHLLATHYHGPGRPFRFCHPRDLLRQVKIYCTFHQLPPVLTPQALDAAVRNYFAMM